MKISIYPKNAESDIPENEANKDPFFKIFQEIEPENPSKKFTQKLIDRWILEDAGLSFVRNYKKNRGFKWILLAFLLLILLPILLLFYLVGNQAISMDLLNSNVNLILNFYTKSLPYTYLVVGLFFLYNFIEFFWFCLKREINKV